MKMPELDSVAKLLALLGIVLYGALFLAYWAFYDRLGVSPEEVGVDNLFILSRSLGFVAFALLLGAITWVGSHYAARLFPPDDSDIGKVRDALVYLLSAG